MKGFVLVSAAALAVSALSACAPQGCSTSTDPATCQNTEAVNNYNRQRQLGAQPRIGTVPESQLYNQGYTKHN